jgi:predicted nucleic acid-binding protein
VIVADASVVVEVLLNTRKGIEIGSRFLRGEETVHVPHLLDLEVLQTMRRYTRSATVGTLRAEQALRYYVEMQLVRYPHVVLAPRIWALRHNWTAYDAAYIALAEALDAPLITCDRAMAANSGHSAEVILI